MSDFARFQFFKSRVLAENDPPPPVRLVTDPAFLGRVFYFRMAVSIADYDAWKFDHPAWLTDAGYVIPQWNDVREITNFQPGRYVLYGMAEVSREAGNAVLRLNQYPGLDFTDLLFLHGEPAQHIVSKISDGVEYIPERVRATLPPLVFCGGVPKSGTTWLEKILNAHPRTLVCGESNLFGAPYLPLLDSSVLPSMPAPFNRYIPFFSGAVEHRVLFYTARAQLILGLLDSLEHQGWAFLGDRTPGNSAQIIPLLLGLPQARFIHIQRAAEDVFLSRLHHEKNLFADSPELCGWTELVARIAPALLDSGDAALKLKNLQEPLLHLARYVVLEWKQINELAEFAARSWPERVLQISYEDMIQHPRQHIRKVYKFLDVDLASDEVARIQALSDFKTLSGGRKRGEKNERAFFRSGTAGGAAGAFSPAFLEKFRALCAMSSRQLRTKLGDIPRTNIEDALFWAHLSRGEHPIEPPGTSQFPPRMQDTPRAPGAIVSAADTGETPKTRAKRKAREKPKRRERATR